MTNIREFIKKLGDKAPSFFDTKEATVARWLKTGSIPMKAVEKVLIAEETLRQLSAPEPEPHVAVDPIPAATEPDIDPLTHLPNNLPKVQPQFGGGRAVSAGGSSPDWIEADPTEQNFGVNMTRPGRINTQPLPPMKIKKVNGQDVPYVEQPAPIKDLPPEIGSGAAGWSDRGAPIPQPKRENERPVPQKQAEGVSEATLP
jgi:hypothetical protein